MTFLLQQQCSCCMTSEQWWYKWYWSSWPTGCWSWVYYYYCHDYYYYYYYYYYNYSVVVVVVDIRRVMVQVIQTLPTHWLLVPGLLVTFDRLRRLRRLMTHFSVCWRMPQRHNHTRLLAIPTGKAQIPLHW